MLAARLSGRTQAVVMVTFIYIAHAVVAVACIPKSQSAVVAEQCQAMSAAFQQHRIERYQQWPKERITSQHCMLVGLARQHQTTGSIRSVSEQQQGTFYCW